MNCFCELPGVHFEFLRRSHFAKPGTLMEAGLESHQLIAVAHEVDTFNETVDRAVRTTKKTALSHPRPIAYRQQIEFETGRVRQTLLS